MVATREVGDFVDATETVGMGAAALGVASLLLSTGPKEDRKTTSRKTTPRAELNKTVSIGSRETCSTKSLNMMTMKAWCAWV